MKRYEKYLKRGFGPHLILDGYGCSKSRLQDMDSVYKFLNEFPDFIGMRKIGSPDVDKILDDEKKEDWGVSGIVLIIESHISIHTFPGKECLFLDVFSCKDFDVEKSKAFIVEWFDIKMPIFTLTQRGSEFPKNIEEAKRIWNSSRKGLINGGV